MKQDQPTLNTVQWLYRYILRGIRWVFLTGFVTWLYLFFRANR